jgi:hypothetical protein
MSREELVAFLRNAQLSVAVMTTNWQTGVSALQEDVPRESLTEIFDKQRVVFDTWCLEQRREWEAFAAVNYAVKVSDAQAWAPLSSKVHLQRPPFVHLRCIHDFDNDPYRNPLPPRRALPRPPSTALPRKRPPSTAPDCALWKIASPGWAPSPFSAPVAGFRAPSPAPGPCYGLPHPQLQLRCFAARSVLRPKLRCRCGALPTRSKSPPRRWWS